jgi:DNA-binding IclR family transcriptional regulator
VSTPTARSERTTERQESGSAPADSRKVVEISVGYQPNRPANGAQVVDRVCDILDILVRQGPELGLSDISRALQLKKATAYRLLASLRRRGMVAQDPDSRRYRLGMRLWELGAVAATEIDWLRRASGVLQDLTNRVGETSHVAVLNEGQVLYVDKVESSRSLRIPSQVGRRLPVHCTGIGKAQIAFLPDETVAGIIEARGLPSFTRNTITSMTKLAEHLAAIRRRGYAVDNEEIEDGLVCIGAPIRDRSGSVVAGISIAGPASRLSPETIPEHAAEVVHAANLISTSLGCPPVLLRPAADLKPLVLDTKRLAGAPQSGPSKRRRSATSPH